MMRDRDNYSNVIAIKEMSAGNDSVGDMWLETKSFHPSTPLRDVIEWGKNSSGKLIVTCDATKEPKQ